MVQFGCLKFCKTILVSSCGLKKVTIIVAFHFMNNLLVFLRRLLSVKEEECHSWRKIRVAFLVPSSHHNSQEVPLCHRLKGLRTR